MGNYKLFNNRFVSVRSLCNQSNVQLNFVRLAKWEISFGEFCYIQMAFVRWTGIPKHGTLLECRSKNFQNVTKM